MYFKVSIVSCCYNPDLEIFEKMLNAIKRQTYPKKLIEHLVMDGGSTNGAEKLAKKYGIQNWQGFPICWL